VKNVLRRLDKTFALTLCVFLGAGCGTGSQTSLPPFTTGNGSPATQAPTQTPTQTPTQIPTQTPTQAPTHAPTQTPTQAPTHAPTQAPTHAPTQAPTQVPTQVPTQAPSSGSAYPNGTPWALPGSIDFDNYNTGGQGVGYNTTVTTNLGGQYRQDGVGIASSVNGGGNGFYVGWSVVGDWYRYSVNVQTTATYYVGVSVDSAATGSVAGTFHIEDQTGRNLTGEVQVPTTGSYSANWVMVNAMAQLNAGANVLKVVIDSGSGLFNLNYMTFSTSAPPTSPPTATPPPSSSGGSVPAPPNAINVQSYGAVGDGQTDNQGALQNAFNAAQSAGRPVYIPPGTYNHSGVLTANGIKIQGAGFNAILYATNYNESAIQMVGGNGSISNLMTKVVAPERSNQPQTTAIWVDSATNASVSTHCTVSHIFVLGTNADGIAATNGASYNTIANNLVYQSADDAYSDDSYIGEPQDTGNQFTGNVAWDVVYGRGFAAAGSINGLFEGNTIDQTTWVGIYAQTDTSSNTQVTSGWTIENDVLLNTVDAPIINGANMTVSNIQFTGSLPNLASVLGWDPTPYIVDRTTFNPTYVPGTGPGANN
jgi:hypothetical protein